MARYDLWPKPYRLLAFAGNEMRLSEDVRKSVVFIGVGEGDDFEPCGTAFILSYKWRRYLVTAHHVIEPLADAPFTIRVNRHEQDALCIPYDPIDETEARWITPSDRSVDLAIMPFGHDLEADGCDFRLVPDKMLLSAAAMKAEDIAVGNICYAVGLFRVHSGKKRNVPLVHTGNVALKAGDEPLPVKDWRAPEGAKADALQMEAHLAEMLSLEGLSGSPVFVRPAVALDGTIGGQVVLSALAAENDLFLLGVWQGAWSGDPDPLLARQAGKFKAPIGVGVVTPAQQLIDLLESEAAIAERTIWLRLAAAHTMPRPDTTS